MGLVLHCADIGSVNKNRFGWARLGVDDTEPECLTGTAIELFVEGIVADINAGHRVAVGFECPLFVPVPEDPVHLTSGRSGEKDRPWSAGAGAGSLATGLTETVWILDRIRRQLVVPCDVHLSWPSFQLGGGMFLWEAFVTSNAKADTHHGDAELAVQSFRERLADPEEANAIVCKGRVRSLIGAALLQTGWTTNLEWLALPCLVIRACPRPDSPKD